MKEFYKKLENALFEKEYKTWQVFLIYLVVAFIVFSPSFLNLNFFWDDERFVFLNPEILNIDNYFNFWKPHSAYFRSWPLGYTIFAFLLKLKIGQSFIFFKLLNVIVHSLNAFLIYQILKKLRLKSFNFVLALIFLVHPLTVESVSWTFQLLTLLSFSFLLLSFYFFINFLHGKKYCNYFFSLLCFLASLWTKSIAILFPFFLLVLAALYFKKNIKLLIVLPFFFFSMIIGILNIEGANYHVKSKNYNLGPDNAIIASKFIGNLYRSLFKIETPAKKNIETNYLNSKYVLDKEYFDFVFGDSDLKAKTLHFDRTSIFAQTLYHYPLKLLFPLNLSFIYKQQKITPLDMFFISAFVTATFAFSMKYFSTKELVVAVAYYFSAIGPYIGLSFITFFYWSYVADRYAYAIIPFLLWLIFKLSIFIKKKKIIAVYLALLVSLNFNYGLLFNNPINLYKNALTQKDHPALYSALFEAYLLKQDFTSAENYVNEGLAKYKDDKTLLNQKARMNIYKINFQ